MAPNSTTKRGDTALPRNRGTGFEDGFADPPMTPEEHATEQKIYDQNNPFHERIEQCVQRFTARRRMKQDQSGLFSKYLSLGGIDTTQRQFTGTAKHVKDWKEEGYTADDIRELSANECLAYDGNAKGKYYNPSFPEHWGVDFAGVVAGFLSSYLPSQGGLVCPDIKLAAETILNFLNYIAHHNVCPEYKDNVQEAIRICKHGPKDLAEIANVSRLLPGDFNLACRILFCSDLKPISTPNIDGVNCQGGLVMYDDKKVTEDGERVNLACGFDTAVLAPANLNFKMVFKATIALHDPKIVERMKGATRGPRVINCFEEAYEVKEIALASQDLVDMYKGLTKPDPSLRPIGPVGHVGLVPTIIEDGWDNHPTLESGRAENPGEPITLYMDHAVLSQLREGTKLRLTICELDIGVKFIKEVSEVLPAFHVFLPQTLMLHWKEPKLDMRPPPSADDPGAAERLEMEEIEREEAAALRDQRKVDPQLDREMREQEDADALEKVMERSKI